MSLLSSSPCPQQMELARRTFAPLCSDFSAWASALVACLISDSSCFAILAASFSSWTVEAHGGGEVRSTAKLQAGRNEHQQHELTLEMSAMVDELIW